MSALNSIQAYDATAHRDLHRGLNIAENRLSNGMLLWRKVMGSLDQLQLINTLFPFEDSKGDNNNMVEMLEDVNNKAIVERYSKQV